MIGRPPTIGISKSEFWMSTTTLTAKNDNGNTNGSATTTKVVSNSDSSSLALTDGSSPVKTSYITSQDNGTLVNKGEATTAF